MKQAGSRVNIRIKGNGGILVDAGLDGEQCAVAANNPTVELPPNALGKALDVRRRSRMRYGYLYTGGMWDTLLQLIELVSW